MDTSRRNLKSVLSLGIVIATMSVIFMLMLFVVFSMRSSVGVSNSYQDSKMSYLGSRGLEYYCTGTCYCGKEEDMDVTHFRRSVQNLVLTRGIVSLLAAASSTMAYKLAKDHFDNRCYDELNQNDCGTIVSEVESCSPAMQMGQLEDDIARAKSEAVGSGASTATDDEKGKFGCSGFCLSVSGNAEDDEFCKKIDHESFLGVKKVDQSLSTDSADAMVLTFIRDELDPYCKACDERCVGMKFGDKPEYDDRDHCRKLPWWHRENIGTYNAGSGGGGGGDDAGGGTAPSGGGGCSASSCKGCSGC